MTSGPSNWWAELVIIEQCLWELPHVYNKAHEREKAIALEEAHFLFTNNYKLWLFDLKNSLNKRKCDTLYLDYDKYHQSWPCNTTWHWGIYYSCNTFRIYYDQDLLNSHKYRTMIMDAYDIISPSSRCLMLSIWSFFG